MHLGLRLRRYTSFEYRDKNDIGDNVEDGDGKDDIDSKDGVDQDDDDQGWCSLVINRDGGLVTSAPPPGCCNTTCTGTN